MGLVSTFTFTSATETVTSTKLNNLVANLLTEFNGSIEAVNIASSTITAAKLANSSVDLTTSVVTGILPAANAASTVGTVGASEIVTADANKDTTGQRNVTITGSYIIGSASMDETDLEKLDGITNGAAAASKCLVLDSGKEVAGITGLGVDSNINMGASCVLAMAVSSTITANGETVTDDQIGYLNDITSDVQAQIDGKVSTAKYAFGSYTGTGSTVNVEFGFQPDLVEIFKSSTFSVFIDAADSGSTATWHGPDGDAGSTYTVTFDAQGFNATGSEVNANSATFYYRASKA